MNIKCLATAILASLTASKAVSAVVEYTYTTNGYDPSSVWEDWELAWLEDEYIGTVYMQAAQPRKMLSFEVECREGDSCAFSGYYDDYTIKNSDANSSVSEITITRKGFTGSIYLDDLSADFSSGDIRSWDMVGDEYGQNGDYLLTDSGDTFSFNPTLLGFFYFAPQAYYCHYTFGDPLDDSNYNPQVCSGGQTARSITSHIDLGQGKWTSRQISPSPPLCNDRDTPPISDGIPPECTPPEKVPLPASLPLLIGALVGLRWLPLRRTA